ncbi:MAG: hypothetical protein UY35_C0005G0155, partial [Candidatus Saccharibacteria bacterium GW2011_GWC2_48_9]
MIKVCRQVLLMIREDRALARHSPPEHNPRLDGADVS